MNIKQLKWKSPDEKPRWDEERMKYRQEHSIRVLCLRKDWGQPQWGRYMFGPVNEWSIEGMSGSMDYTPEFWAEVPLPNNFVFDQER